MHGLLLQVRIVRERGTGKVLAMKKLRKAEMLRRGQVEHVKAERNVLAEVHSPYIVKLYYSFQVRNCKQLPLQPVACMCYGRALDPNCLVGAGIALRG
jgi:serine/threonine protein kinase